MVRTLDHPAMETRYFGLVACADHRREIVRQNVCRTRQDRLSDVLAIATRCPVDQLSRGLRDRDLVAAHDIALAKSEAR
jgi:hypothetical protein